MMFRDMHTCVRSGEYRRTAALGYLVLPFAIVGIAFLFGFLVETVFVVLPGFLVEAVFVAPFGLSVEIGAVAAVGGLVWAVVRVRKDVFRYAIAPTFVEWEMDEVVTRHNSDEIDEVIVFGSAMWDATRISFGLGATTSELIRWDVGGRGFDALLRDLEILDVSVRWTGVPGRMRYIA